MKLKLFSLLMIASFTTISAPLFAADTCDGTDQHPCVVQDTNDNSSDIKHWRDGKMIADAYKGDTSGLKHLWASVSAAPSKKNFKAIAKNIDKSTDGKVKKMIDLDLRQEDHGYLNDNAITLADHYNWINLGKTTQQSLAAEQAWLQQLFTQNTINDVLTPDQFKSDHFNQGMNVQIEKLVSEQQIAEDAGFEYHRLTVSDHMAPRDEDVDTFVTLVRGLSSNTWLHMHCRGGDGRATTFFAMYDIFKNADKVSFNEIIQRQAAVVPNYDLFNLTNEDPVIVPYYKARLKFLMEFYQFSSAALRGYTGNWTDWKKEKSLHTK